MAPRTSFTPSGTEIESVYPATTANGGAIIIAYGSDGMKEPWDKMIQGYADSLAEKGFITMTPDYLGFTNTEPGPGVFTLIETLRPAWIGAISETIDCAKAITDIKVDPKRIGLLGFSLGGHLCLQLRAKAKVLVEFFAPYFDGIGLPGTLTRAQIHHGEDDRLPATNFRFAEQIRNILLKETAAELWGYKDAGHGFITESSLADVGKAKALIAALGGTDPGNTTAQKESKDRTIRFFEMNLST